MATPLKIAIVEKDLTQGKLAKLAGIGATAMSSLVRGNSRPDIVTALKIARILGKSVEELWGYLLDDK